MKWSVRILTLVIALALVALAVNVMKPQPADVDVAKVTHGPLAQYTVSDGKARVRERYTVSAPVAGTLARIELHEGDVVEPGAVIARLLPLASPLLDPESRAAAQARLSAAIDSSSQAQATVARADIANEEAKRDLARTRGLTEHGGAAPVQLDQAAADARMREAELASAKFAARVSEHEIGQMRAALARYTPGATTSEQIVITSPVHGQVLHIFHKSEGVVAAGTALLEVGDPAALELVTDVLSEDAVGIHAGMQARVTHWGGDAPLAARVRRVEPAAFTKTSALGVEEQRVNVILDLDATNDSPLRSLGDGFALEIEITTWSTPAALQVPSSALFRDGSEWALFVVRNGTAHKQHVIAGHPGPLQTEITSGVVENDVVIIHPGAGVHDGVGVTFR